MALQSITTGSFAVGETVSNPLVLNSLTPVGIITTGSNHSGSIVSFLVSNDNTNFYPLFNSDGTEYTVSASFVARAYPLDPNTFFPWTYLKVRLGTSSSAIAQKTVTSYMSVVSQRYIR